MLSPRKSITGENIVATTQPLAVDAGLQMIRLGGNAVDAAIATAITLTVVEPTMNGIGSDAFCIVWDGNKLHGLNASGRFPEEWKTDDFITQPEMPKEGWASVTVPGAVSAWAALSQKFGKLNFEKLFEPAIEHATSGFAVTPIIARQWFEQAPRLKDIPGFSEAFLPNGKAPVAGEIFRNPTQARTLHLIAKSCGRDFYEGKLASELINHSNQNGGKLTLRDLQSHKAEWVKPIQANYRDITVHEIPPNGQGIATLMALTILDEFEDKIFDLTEADRIHLEIEAMRLAFNDTYQHIADPDFMKISIDQLLDTSRLKQLAKQIKLNETCKTPASSPGENSDTVYLSTADANGMMVSFIQSNYMGFGSGIVIPGTGISLQNRAAGFVVNPKHPNCVAGGKKPFHTIIPGFITRGSAAHSSFGVMGGDMQAQGHLQICRAMARDKQDPQQAINHSRWKLNKEGNLVVEDSYQPEILSSLKAKGHTVSPIPYGSFDFGASQVISKIQNGFIGGSEPRRDGLAKSITNF